MLLPKRIHLPASSWGVTSTSCMLFSLRGPLLWSPVWAIRGLDCSSCIWNEKKSLGWATQGGRRP